ncbi:helix-turn-helix domain-containing protein [Pararhodobacter marinus]|uniref:helix-turn-helix domain-containing protein n=1 Tax=Pararhodobacter marinus TaxID=2184063 RepID=UPI00351425D7
MALDGNRLRKLRTSKGMSQEKLAILANVNKRTIQRAEKGDRIALETAAFIAEALGVSAASLRGTQVELFERDAKEWNEVVLIPVNSGRRVIDALRFSFEAEISFDVEPTNDNIEPLAQVSAILEPFKPDPWATPIEAYAPAQAEVMKKQAELNALLPVLSEMGINIFFGTYAINRQIPSYDHEEGGMFIMPHFRFCVKQSTIVVVSDTSATHLVRKPEDLHSSTNLNHLLDSEMPF